MRLLNRLPSLHRSAFSLIEVLLAIAILALLLALRQAHWPRQP